MGTEPSRRTLPLPAVAAGYVALTCAFYWGAVAHLTTRYISDGNDGANFLWSYWQIPRALLHGHDPFSTRLIFWPVGVRLAFHTNTPIEALLTWLVTKPFGLVLGTNLVQLAAVVAAGLGAFLLARRECGDDRAAAVAGAAFAFIPQHTGRIIGHWNLNQTWVLPFGLLAVLWLYDQPSWRRAVGLGAMAAVIATTDLTFFLFWLGAAVLIAAWRWRETFTRAVGGRLALGGAVMAVLASPLLVSMVGELRHHELDPVNQWGGAESHAADLLGWIAPSPHHPLWGALGSGLKASIFELESYPYVGILILVLAVVAVVMRAERTGRWAVVAAAFMLLALGPFLQVNGHTGSGFTEFGRHFAVPLPFDLFHRLPVLSGLRIPGRFAIMAALALDVLAAIGLVRLTRGRSAMVQWLVPAVVLVVTMVELLPPPRIVAQPTPVPAAYRAVAHSRDAGAVLEIPLFWRDGFGQVGDANEDSIFLYYATKHHHPITGGMVARLPSKRWAELFQIDPYRQLLGLQHQPGFDDPASFTGADLRRLGIGFVAYHRSRPMPDVLAYVQTLGLQQLADDGDTIIWHVPPS